MTSTDAMLEVQLAERQMCAELLALAKVYFGDPKVQARFEAWKNKQKTKES